MGGHCHLIGRHDHRWPLGTLGHSWVRKLHKRRVRTCQPPAAMVGSGARACIEGTNNLHLSSATFPSRPHAAIRPSFGFVSPWMPAQPPHAIDDSKHLESCEVHLQALLASCTSPVRCICPCAAAPRGMQHPCTNSCVGSLLMPRKMDACSASPNARASVVFSVHLRDALRMRACMLPHLSAAYSRPARPSSR
eukprot:359240-Chlamydomonas_euryale.AAC.5